MKILCLHGFMGSERDFDFLNEKFDVIAPSLNHLVCLSFEDLAVYIDNLVKDYDEVMILGYSFGARLGLRLFKHNPSKYKKVICLGGHLGLESQAEREERRRIEEDFKFQLKYFSKDEFIKFWNELELFQYDKNLEVNYGPKLIYYFENYGLMNQPYLKNEIINYRDKIHFYYGELDTKYCEYAKNNLEGFNVQFIPNRGHRLIHDHQLVASLLGDSI